MHTSLAWQAQHGMHTVLQSWGQSHKPTATPDAQADADAALVVAQMQAEINLLTAALKDPLTQRFVTLSESCVPVFPAEASWLQLMAQPLSRINACLDQNSQGDLDRVMLYRWGLQMHCWGEVETDRFAAHETACCWLADWLTACTT